MTDPTDAGTAITAEVDATGLLCPLPVLRARKRLIAMAPGQVLRLIATDPAAIVDVPHFCAEAGHTLIATASIASAWARSSGVLTLKNGSPSSAGKGTIRAP
ncbi:MAG: sulfurtransferase TusA family protein [Rhodobacteraceae bacterium]|nr:sulfurtransferase TusA family protein [Paracoccaceae bacterium]